MSEPAPLAPWWQVIAIGVVVAAAIGFMTGTRGDAEPARALAPSVPESDAPLTPTYSAMRDAPLGPNRDRHAAAIERMRADHPARTDEDIPPRSDDAVAAELARRAELRSYNGAPPRIPHPIGSRGPLDCVACHRDGMRIGGVIAPPMSHRELTSCTQCHVPDEGQMPGPRVEGGPPTESAFAGLAAPMRGPRMYPGAPPQIPHSTQMRERCDSCHGVWGRGIRTTHPWRQSCQQCHAPGAALDQRQQTLSGGPPVEPMPEAAP